MKIVYKNKINDKYFVFKFYSYQPEIDSVANETSNIEDADVFDDSQFKHLIDDSYTYKIVDYNQELRKLKLEKIQSING